MFGAARGLVVPIALVLLLWVRGPAPASVEVSPADVGSGPPLGDGKLSNGPRVGYVWPCGRPLGGGGAQRAGPWIKGRRWEPAEKLAVGGEVSWPSELAVERIGPSRAMTGNGLPSHPTGVFPIRSEEPAFRYDRNPNRIQPQRVQAQMPVTPTVAAQPRCLPMGPIGVMLTGAALFNALDLDGRDAAAYEVQDRCGGHPERNGRYHYHALPPCAPDLGAGHSALLGYALDGFGIFGKRGVDGAALRNVDLDECHGHVHAVESVETYHYHATDEYPYTLGCFRG